MKVAFRVDAGTAMGGGHLSRCLTLANALKLNGVTQCYFIMKAHQGDFTEQIISGGFEVEVLPLEFKPDYYSGDYKHWVGGNILNDAKSTLDYLNKNGFTFNDWLIIDHYGIDIKFEDFIANIGFKVGVIDDLVNRKHSCRFLIDQTCGRKELEYKALVDRDTIVMTGQDYCMLRPEFLKLRGSSLSKRRKFTAIKSLFINFGSTDPTNVTSKVIDTISKASKLFDYNIVVAVGSNTLHLDLVKSSVASFSGEITLIIDAQNMSELMLEADVAIGAAGATTWERCALGLPTVIIQTAANQSTVISRILDFEVVVLYDLEVNDQASELKNHLTYIQDNYTLMSEKCFNLVKADGVNKIVAKVLASAIK